MVKSIFVILFLACFTHANAQIQIHRKTDNLPYVPVLLNGEAVYDAYMSKDSTIEPTYRYKDPSKGLFVFNQSFKYAEPFDINGLAVVEFADESQYGVINLNGETLFKNAEYIEITPNRKFIFGTKTETNTTLYGLANDKGEIIVPPQYSSIEFIEELGIFQFESTEDLQGLLDSSGRIITPAQWQSIKFESLTEPFTHWINRYPNAYGTNYVNSVLQFYSVPYWIVLNKKIICALKEDKFKKMILHPLIDEKNEEIINEDVRIKDGEAYFITQVALKNKSAFRIRNLLGKIIFQTPYYSKRETEKLLEEDFFPNKIKLFQGVNDNLLFILPNIKNSKKHEFHLIDMTGKVVVQKTDIQEFYEQNNQIYLKTYDKNEEVTNFCVYDEQNGLIGNIVDVSSSDGVLYYLKTNNKKELFLHTDIAKINLPFIFDSKNNYRLRIYSNFGARIWNDKSQEYFVNINQKTCIPINQLVSVTDDKICFITNKNPELFVSTEKNILPVKLDNKLNLENANIIHFTEDYIAISKDDSIYFYHYSGNLYRTIEESQYREVENNLDWEYFTFSHKDSSKELLYTPLRSPNLYLKKLYHELSLMGATLGQDTNDNIWYIPKCDLNSGHLSQGSNTQNVNCHPILLQQSDPNFINYQITNLANDGNVNKKDLFPHFENSKLALEIIYNDSIHRFWVSFLNEIKFSGTYLGSFFNAIKFASFGDLEYMNDPETVWKKEELPIYIYNGRGKVYLFKPFTPNSNLNVTGLSIDSFNLINVPDSMLSSIKIQYTREYFGSRFGFYGNQLKTFKNLDQLLWITKENQEVGWGWGPSDDLIGIYNTGNRSWLSAPNQEGYKFVFAHPHSENNLPFILLRESTSENTQIFALNCEDLFSFEKTPLMSIQGKIQSIIFFDEYELGVFIQIKVNDKLSIYRINQSYQPKSIDPENSKLSLNQKLIISEFGYSGPDDNPIDNPYFRMNLDFGLPMSLPVYFNAEGELYWEENR